ncbi:MAG: DUF1624 domain-containing protein [Candidatus Heimdallarchaeota archaeon]|nr:DUF1624 domain-containing protein [Candidatus Heimdallarchaeota archaeon]
MIIKKPDGRFWEIDLFRGIAIIIMVIFHFIYDLNHIRIIYYKLWEGPFDYVSKITASFFFILAGISLTLSYNKSKHVESKTKMRQRFVFRGLKLLSLGMIITAISYVLIPERFVIFGVLHCIGLSIILAIPFISFRRLNVLVGSIMILFGVFLKTVSFNSSWLVPLGIVPPKYFSIDFFPLFPWFGVLLIGISLGHYLYPEAQRRVQFSMHPESSVLKNICFIGRHSLHIYFLHQPILLGIIFLILFQFS